jgi:rhodanese-related sulfurtransferase
MMKDQSAFYELKLQYEIDSSDLFDSLNRGEKIKVIDTRSNEAFEEEHIPGAINIPHRTMSVESTSPLDKEFMYVSYCDGIGCNASTKGALNMAKLGFAVKELIGGLEWWKRDGYETHGLKATKGNEFTCRC